MSIRDLEQKRGQLANEMNVLHEAAQKEDRSFTSEERESWDKKVKAVDDLDTRIEDEKRMSDIFARYTDEEIATAGVEKEARQVADKEVSHKDAFSALLRSTSPGVTGLSQAQQQALTRAQSVGTDSAGGYLAPDEFQQQIIDKMVAYGGIRGAATVINTENGNQLEIPTLDDTGNSGAILAENTQDSEQDMAFGQKLLNAYKYTSKIIRVSTELLQDNAFDLDGLITNKFSERLGRATAAHYAAGTGSSQPNGLSVAATSGKTAASATAFTYLELLDLKHSVDPAYRSNAQWCFNDATLLDIKQLVDGDGRPLWRPSIDDDRPATIDGNGYVIDQGMPSVATTTKPIVYGDLSGYWIRDVMGVTVSRLVERYADYHQVGFVAILRTDGELIDANAVRAMTMA